MKKTNRYESLSRITSIAEDSSIPTISEKCQMELLGALYGLDFNALLSLSSWMIDHCIDIAHRNDSLLQRVAKCHASSERSSISLCFDEYVDYIYEKSHDTRDCILPVSFHLESESESCMCDAFHGVIHAARNKYNFISPLSICYSIDSLVRFLGYYRLSSLFSNDEKCISWDQFSRFFIKNEYDFLEGIRDGWIIFAKKAALLVEKEKEQDFDKDELSKVKQAWKKFDLHLPGPKGTAELLSEVYGTCR